MAIQKDRTKAPRRGAKTVWNPYALQALSQRQFISVVGKILKQEHRLLSVRSLPALRE
ncbi:MAG: hypothetical protein ABIK83_03635 [Candidatus Zixiibacteriota bacterium]